MHLDKVDTFDLPKTRVRLFFPRPRLLFPSSCVQRGPAGLRARWTAGALMEVVAVAGVSRYSDLYILGYHLYTLFSLVGLIEFDPGVVVVVPS